MKNNFRKDKILLIFKTASDRLLSLWMTSRPARFSPTEEGLASWKEDIESYLGIKDEEEMVKILGGDLDPAVLGMVKDWQTMLAIFPRGEEIRRSWIKNRNRDFSSFIDWVRKTGNFESNKILSSLNAAKFEDEKKQEPKKSEESYSAKPPSGGNSWLFEISDAVKNISRANGIPEGIIFAQGSLESNYGKSHIGGFNYFGMKGEGTAGSISAKTKEEFKPGEVSTIRDKFKKFNNLEEGFQSYANLLKQSNRFSYATQAFSDDPAKFAIWIWGRGYATDSKYPDKLSSISKNIAQKLGRPELAWDYDGEERRIIDTLSSMRPEDRVSKTVELLKTNSMA
jgi:hypothetical protein